MSWNLKLKCRNCGKTWNKKVEEGKIAKQKSTGSTAGVTLMPEGKMRLSDIQKIKCPNCGVKQKVRKRR